MLVGRILKPLGVAGLLIAIVGASLPTVWGEEPSSKSWSPARNSPPSITGKTESSKKRLRQGTILDKVKGEFRLTGERVAFYPQTPDVKEMTVLENLALERLSELVAENRRRIWLVSGMVTEFRGKNYLLVSRAVLTSETTASAGQP